MVFLIEGSYGYASSRIQPLPLLDSRKSGNASSFTLASSLYWRRFMELCLQQMEEQFKSLIVLSHYLEVSLRLESLKRCLSVCLLRVFRILVCFAFVDWEVPAVLG